MFLQGTICCCRASTILCTWLYLQPFIYVYNRLLPKKLKGATNASKSTRTNYTSTTKLTILSSFVWPTTVFGPNTLMLSSSHCCLEGACWDRSVGLWYCRCTLGTCTWSRRVFLTWSDFYSWSNSDCDGNDFRKDHLWIKNKTRTENQLIKNSFVSVAVKVLWSLRCIISLYIRNCYHLMYY